MTHFSHLERDNLINVFDILHTSHKNGLRFLNIWTRMHAMESLVFATRETPPVLLCYSGSSFYPAFLKYTRSTGSPWAVIQNSHLFVTVDRPYRSMGGPAATKLHTSYKLFGVWNTRIPLSNYPDTVDLFRKVAISFSEGK